MRLCTAYHNALCKSNINYHHCYHLNPLKTFVLFFSSSPCHNGGVCTNKRIGEGTEATINFECDCKDAWLGDVCTLCDPATKGKLQNSVVKGHIARKVTISCLTFQLIVSPSN